MKTPKKTREMIGAANLWGWHAPRGRGSPASVRELELLELEQI